MFMNYELKKLFQMYCPRQNLFEMETVTMVSWSIILGHIDFPSHTWYQYFGAQFGTLFDTL